MSAVDYHYVLIPGFRRITDEVDVVAVDHRWCHDFVAICVPFATLNDGADLVNGKPVAASDQVLVAVIIRRDQTLGSSQF